MSKLWIKICGITRNNDARAAADLGSDAIGLIFYPRSPRAIAINQVREITSGINSTQKVVALFVDPSKDEVNSVLDTNRIDILQFHGSESAEFCNSFGVPYLKAFSVLNSGAVKKVVEKYNSAEYILLDSYSKQVPGGTGKTFDWNIAKTIIESSDSKFIVAGGLSPENVKAAVALAKPFGVDVSSGVESSHGIKNVDKIGSFILGARSA